MKIFQNILIAILTAALLVSSLVTFKLKKESNYVVNEYKIRSECEEIARSFSIEYNNLFRDVSHNDKNIFKSYCTEDFYNDFIDPMEPQHAVSEETVISNNDITNILSKTSSDFTEVVIVGKQSFEYTEYTFTYYFKFNSNNKIEEFKIISVQ